jgi:ribosomal protein S18 acetylase RimI-like enzyme
MVTTPGEFVPAVPPTRTGPGNGFEIAWAQDAGTLEEAREVAAAGSGPGPLLAMYEPRVVAIPGLRIYVGRVGGRPVTTAIGWTASAATGIFQVATAPACRGRGYGGAVTSRAVLDGFAAGADLAWLQASRLGERLYEGLGFRRV